MHHRRTVRYEVTFEFKHRPMRTHRGIVEGWQAGTLASRAIRQAQKALHPREWISLVARLSIVRPAEVERPS
jgi:hypothetical protein